MIRHGFLVVLIVLSSSINAQTSTASKLQTYFAKLRAEGFSGAMLVTQQQRTLFLGAAGYANRATKRAYTTNTPHMVASISKMITAMAALKLRDAGKLELGKSICAYLPDCPKLWQAITVQHLMRHSSGLRDYETQLGLYSAAYANFMTQKTATASIIANAKTQSLAFAPGTQFQYSNTGYVLLSSILEIVAQEPFNALVARTVLQPAGMNSSAMLGAIPATMATGYRKNGQAVPQLALTPPAGDAALVSTLQDLQRWSEIMDGGNAMVSHALAQEVFAPGLGGYGYGWFIDTRFGRVRHVHTGELPGYRTVFIKYPSVGLTILIFANSDGAPTETIARGVTQIVLRK